MVERFEQGIGCNAAANTLGVSKHAVQSLYRRFVLRGRLCLVGKPTKQHYLFEVKEEVVEGHLVAESKMNLAREFGLSSDKVVEYWLQE